MKILISYSSINGYKILPEETENTVIIGDTFQTKSEKKMSIPQQWGAFLERKGMYNESGFLSWLATDLEGRKLPSSISYCKGLL